MTKKVPEMIAVALIFLAIPPVAHIAAAQTVTAVPSLDLNRYMGPWYEIARFPVKREKHCLGDEMVLYALGDKRNSFQVVTSCQIKDGNSDYWNDRGKSSKSGDGTLKLSRIWPLTTKYWVLATGQAYEWALVGSPNHKTLWVLSRSTTLKPEVLAEIEAKAAAQGFNTTKLIKISQHE